MEKKHYISFETAKMLKDIGIILHGEIGYLGDSEHTTTNPPFLELKDFYPMVEIQYLTEWIRIHLELFIEVRIFFFPTKRRYYFTPIIYNLVTEDVISSGSSSLVATPEEAAELGIQEVLSNLAYGRK